MRTVLTSGYLNIQKIMRLKAVSAGYDGLNQQRQQQLSKRKIISFLGVFVWLPECKSVFI